jgi:hypothetical protein
VKDFLKQYHEKMLELAKKKAEYQHSLLKQRIAEMNEKKERLRREYLNEKIAEDRMLLEQQIQEHKANVRRVKDLLKYHHKKMLELAKKKAEFQSSIFQQSIVEISDREELKRENGQTILNYQQTNRIPQKGKITIQENEDNVLIHRDNESQEHDPKNEYLAMELDERLSEEQYNVTNEEQNNVENIKEHQSTSAEIYNHNTLQMISESSEMEVNNEENESEFDEDSDEEMVESQQDMNNEQRQESNDNSALESLQSTDITPDEFASIKFLFTEDKKETYFSFESQDLNELFLGNNHHSVTFDIGVRESIIQPIISQFSTIGSIMHSILFNNLKLEEHFISLRRYFMLQAGDFVDGLACTLFEKLDQGTLLSIYDLNNILQDALKRTDYLERDAKFVERLSFSMKPLPNHKILDAHVIDVFDHIYLNYHVDFPLDIILNSKVMSNYNKIYNFLMKMKRMELVLQEIWTHLTKQINRRSFDRRIMRLQIFRQEIQHFMTIMQSYIMTQVISSKVQEFIENVVKAESISRIIQMHDEFLQQIIKMCLLDDSMQHVMQIITSSMNLILRFRLQLLANPLCQPLSTPAFDAMMNTREEFQRQVLLLYSALKKVKPQTQYPAHSSSNPFTLLLNFNEFYEMEDK